MESTGLSRGFSNNFVSYAGGQQSNQDCEVFGPDRSERKDWNHKYKVFGAESAAGWLSFSQIQTQIQNTTARQAPFGKTVQSQQQKIQQIHTQIQIQIQICTQMPRIWSRKIGI